MRAAGRLKEIVEIYSNSIVKDEYGQEKETRVLKQSTRAELKHNSGNRELENSEIVHNYTKTLVVRYYVDVEDYDLIKWENKFYRVIDVEPSKDYQFKTIRMEKCND